MSDPQPPDPAGQPPHSADIHHPFVAAALLHWARRPRAQANRVVVTIAAVSMAWLLVFAWPLADRSSLLRDVAMMFTIAHCVWHFLALRGLRRLCARGVAGADEALSAYLDPFRISHLDQAAAWLALALLVRFVALVST